MLTFVNFICEQLSPLGLITHRKMFGGYGIFLNQQMIAIIDKHEKIFIKKQSITSTDLRFSYLRQQKTVYLNYVFIEQDFIDESDEFVALVSAFLYNKET